TCLTRQILVLADRAYRGTGATVHTPYYGRDLLRAVQPGCVPSTAGLGCGSVAGGEGEAAFEGDLEGVQGCLPAHRPGDHAQVRAPGERAFADLKQWRILRKARRNPNRISRTYPQLLQTTDPPHHIGHGLSRENE
ncbi:hypothetical protein ACH49K_34665, partial [Streptomyces sp. NPDC019539]